jgi:hypothetical protein
MLGRQFERCFSAFYASNRPLAQGNNAQAAIKYIVSMSADGLLLLHHITALFTKSNFKLAVCYVAWIAVFANGFVFKISDNLKKILL